MAGGLIDEAGWPGLNAKQSRGTVTALISMEEIVKISSRMCVCACLCVCTGAVLCCCDE